MTLAAAGRYTTCELRIMRDFALQKLAGDVLSEHEAAEWKEWLADIDAEITARESRP